MPRAVLLLLVTLLLASSCRDHEPALRIETAPGTPPSGAVALPEAWSSRYRGALGASTAIVLTLPSPAEATAAVRDGRARFALGVLPAGDGLTAAEFDAMPLALIVPLTFPVEEVTSAQVRNLSAGKLRLWQDIGGPALPVSVTAAPALLEGGGLSRVLGDSSAVVPGDGPPPPGTLSLGWWNGPSLGYKALRVDGRDPDEPDYPLIERRVVLARDADRTGGQSLASAVQTSLAAKRAPIVTLDAVGDLMLGREVGRLMTERGPAFALDAVRPLLSASDVRFGNLEIPLTDRGTPAKKDYVFRAPPSATAALTHGDVSVVSLANNHALDYGPDGLLDTIAALDRAGIAHAGAGSTPEEAHAPAIVTIKGLRLAFLAYVNVPNDSVTGFVAASMTAAPGRPGVAWGAVDVVRRDVAAAKAQADLVIVSMHSGYEYTTGPNDIQRALAHAAVEAGAALVLGGHPHVLQGLELYRGAPIIYSLGNFVFDLDNDDLRQPGLPSVLTMIFRVTLTRNGVQGVRFLPAIIDAQEARPVPVSGIAARPVLDRLYRLTDALNK